MIQKLIALLFLILFLPLFFVFFICVKLTSKGPFIFKQKRIGKNKKIFTIYKIRTMIVDAEKLKKKYFKLNEVDNHVFKIQNDPRFTKFGKVISSTGLDELPQLVNIIKGEMAFVGPRPLPVDEAMKIPKKYEERSLILPGITSTWVLKGQHKLTFAEWMILDLKYIQEKSTTYDLIISINTVLLIIKIIWKKFI